MASSALGGDEQKAFGAVRVSGVCESRAPFGAFASYGNSAPALLRLKSVNCYIMIWKPSVPNWDPCQYIPSFPDEQGKFGSLRAHIDILYVVHSSKFTYHHLCP